MNLTDPGGRVVDFLRSCYSTKMVLSQDGHQSQVDWYFAQAGAPLLGLRNRMSSLNYLRPTIPPGVIGEVPGATRPWRDGSRPSYIGSPSSTFSTSGIASDWLNGVVTNYGPIQVNYLGQKGFPYAERRGLFPRWQLQLPVPQLTSSVRGVADEATASNFYGWTWSVQPAPALGVLWGRNNDEVPLWTCNPDLHYAAFNRVDGVSGKLLCTSWNTTTGVSVWADPSGVLGGETFTINGFPQ